MNTCRPTKISPSEEDPLEAIVRAYREKKESNEDRYWQYYHTRRSLTDAITKAAMAELPSGKRFSHQRRIPRAVLIKMKDTLVAAQGSLSACKTFDELLELIDRLTRNITGIGNLTVYDTAHRLGAYLNLRPEFVYLHAGARTGAKALGLDHRANKLPLNAFPKALHQLRPEQIEDCICIFKKELIKVTCS